MAIAPSRRFARRDVAHSTSNLHHAYAVGPCCRHKALVPLLLVSRSHGLSFNAACADQLACLMSSNAESHLWQLRWETIRAEADDVEKLRGPESFAFAFAAMLRWQIDGLKS